jgi:hypothetical protein
MPKFLNGDIWNSIGDIYVTTNSFVKKSSYKLVMGRGLAAEAARKFPSIASYFGTEIIRMCGHLGEYNIISAQMFKHNKYSRSIGAFQVKYRWMDNADYDLIYKSTIILAWLARVSSDKIININYPGIGNGGLDRDKVYEVIKLLPDNVYIWSKEGS